MKNNLFYVAVLAGIAIFLWFQKKRGGNYVGDKPATINVEQVATQKETIPSGAPNATPEIKKELQNPAPAVGSDVAGEIKKELQNPSAGVGPNIAIGSKVKLEYKIRNAKTGVLIAETGNNDLPTNFQIGEPNVFGDFLMKLVGANKGAILKITLPPKFWVPNPAAQEFAKSHALSNDVILLIEFKVVGVVAK